MRSKILSRLNLYLSIKAYTLIELSILLLASGIVLGSLYYMYQMLNTQYSRQVTISRQEIVLRAIGRYTKQFGFLPYPALNIKDGLQQKLPAFGDRIPQSAGYIPWRTLGIPKELAYDGNGRPLFFLMNPAFGCRIDVSNNNLQSFSGENYTYTSNYSHISDVSKTETTYPNGKIENDVALVNPNIKNYLEVLSNGSNVLDVKNDALNYLPELETESITFKNTQSLNEQNADCVAVILVGQTSKNSFPEQFKKIELKQAIARGVIVKYVSRFNIVLYGGPSYCRVEQSYEKRLRNIYQPGRPLLELAGSEYSYVKIFAKINNQYTGVKSMMSHLRQKFPHLEISETLPLHSLKLFDSINSN